MKRFLLFLGASAAVVAALAQNYTSNSSGQPISRSSFLRSQMDSATDDPKMILDLPLTEPYNPVQYSDRSGKYSASMSGAYQNNLSGKVGSWAPYFNHVTVNYLTVSPTPTIPSTFTVMAWVHANALTGGYNRIVDAGYKVSFSLLTDPATNPTKYEFIMNNNLDSNACSGGTISKPGGSNPAWPNNPWDFVAVAYNGSTATLYVNGVSVASGCSFGTFTGSSTYTVVIGNCPDGNCSTDHWDGQIQGVRILGRAMSAAEIQAIYAAENH